MATKLALFNPNMFEAAGYVALFVFLEKMFV
jgi:hypothetical protein